MSTFRVTCVVFTVLSVVTWTVFAGMMAVTTAMNAELWHIALRCADDGCIPSLVPDNLTEVAFVVGGLLALGVGVSEGIRAVKMSLAPDLTRKNGRRYIAALALHPLVLMVASMFLGSTLGAGIYLTFFV